MNRPHTFTRLALAVCLAALALVVPSKAADYNMAAYQKDDWNTPAYSWAYKVDTSDPQNGSTCAASNYYWKTGHLNVFEVGEPFSGSKSRSRWVTTCQNGRYVTYKLDISLNNCGLWICDTVYKATPVRTVGVNHEQKLTVGFSATLEALVQLP